MRLRSLPRTADTIAVPWIQLRPRSDPAFWVPLLLSVLLLVPLGFGAHVWLSHWQDHIRRLASVDPVAAQTQALRALRLGSWSLSLLLAAFSAYLFRFFQLGLQRAQLPPPGWWSFGAFRVAVGPTARRMSRLGLLMTAVLLASSVGLLFAVEHLVRILSDGKLAA